jgi:hypothetical protein
MYRSTFFYFGTSWLLSGEINAQATLTPEEGAPDTHWKQNKSDP